MTDAETQEYEIKKVGIAISDSVQETLVIKGEDGERDEFKAGDTITITPDKATELRKLGVTLAKPGGSDSKDDESEESVQNTETSDTTTPNW